MIIRFCVCFQRRTCKRDLRTVGGAVGGAEVVDAACGVPQATSKQPFHVSSRDRNLQMEKRIGNKRGRK